ncbi:hypothetical protein [Acetobacterium sp. KB-1]|uniref:hypothetical protein n=1 Tax=Acetobacterium sp. KB-1 TaxID=2184575 RepID=UPI0013A69F87|nr:hypothetical protein [Acetobacterium sp. KB-1]MDZ5726687.1 hypothetical protein [Acetobacterium sp. K1/6]
MGLLKISLIIIAVFGVGMFLIGWKVLHIDQIISIGKAIFITSLSAYFCWYILEYLFL